MSSSDQLAQRTPEVISGFDLIFKNERILILEINPGSLSQLIDEASSHLPMYLLSYTNSNLLYSSPRLYNHFDSLIKEIKTTLSAYELIVKYGVYSRRSPFYVLFGIVQKINFFLSTKSFQHEFEYPSESELVTLMVQLSLMEKFI